MIYQRLKKLILLGLVYSSLLSFVNSNFMLDHIELTLYIKHSLLISRVLA